MCPKYAHLRDPYIQAIHSWIAKVERIAPYRATRLRYLLTLPCLRSCGIVPDDLGLDEAHAELPTEQHYDLFHSHPFDASNCWYEGGYIRCFTDGSCLYPRHFLLARAGYSVFFGPNHPNNITAPLKGPSQTSYRAELRAILAAIRTCPHPLWITTDCMAVKDTAQAIIDGLPLPKGVCDRDLWDHLIPLLRGRDNIRISWIKAHLDPDIAEHYVLAGVFTSREVEANEAADKAAKQAASTYLSNIDIIRSFEERVVTDATLNALTEA